MVFTTRLASWRDGRNALEADLLAASRLALVAAFLNADLGLCLGSELYLLLRRLAPQS